MVGFKATYINELFKIQKKKKLVIALILSIIAVLIGQISVTLVNQSLGLLIVNSTELPIIILGIMMYTIFPLFITFIAIDMFNGEYNANTMKLTLTKPASRFCIFTAKFTALASVIVVNLLFVFLLSLIVGIIFNPSSTTASGIFHSLVAYVVSVLPLLVFGLLVIVLANIIRGGLAVFFLTVMIFAGFYVIGLLFTQASSFLFTSMFDWYRLWISEAANLFKLLRLSLIMIGFGLMLYSLGYTLFERKVI